MALKNSDAQMLQHILKYCFEVEAISQIINEDE
jgi:Na+/phosphate symporter